MSTLLFYNDIENKILINLRKTKSEVKIAVSWLTNLRLFNEVVNLLANNVVVTIILADDIINFTNPKIDFNKLIHLNAEIRVSRYPKLMHNKFCIIDNRFLIQGSYNWTLKAEHHNFENIILSTDKQIIIQFNDYFEQLKTITEKLNKIDITSFKKYNSQAEIDFEYELETTKDTYDLNNHHQEKELYTDDINTEIDNLDLLYNDMKHQECINKCKILIQKHPDIHEFNLILAKSYWRTNQITKMIESAKKVIEINNEEYGAYNLLGIAFSNRIGGEKEAIKNYDIFLDKYPKNTIVLRNRALAGIILEEVKTLPSNIITQYINKTDKDLNKIIELLGSKNYDELNYNELDCLAFSYYHLNKKQLAIDKINEAIRKFKETKDIFDKDKNVLKDMKEFRKLIISGK